MAKKQPSYRPHFAILPAYKKTLDLDEQFTRSTAKVPREIKYGRISKLRDIIMDILVQLAFADMNESDRIRHIDTAQTLLNRLKVEVRILYDLKYIKDTGLDAIIREEGNLAAQLDGWRNSIQEKQHI